MKRRSFLSAAAAAPVAAWLPRFALAQSAFDPRPGAWRTFEVVTRVDVLKPAAGTRVWLPLPLPVETDHHKPLGDSWTGNMREARVFREPQYNAAGLYAAWADDEPAPSVEVTSRFMTRDRATDFARPDPTLRLDAASAKFYTAPTALLPTDGIVRKTALEATQGAPTDVAKARAIYDWIVENTFRDPKTRGCGVGDIKGMLETGNLGGKCADLNALFVGLARSAGLPARDVYGVRVAKCQFGYRSLGAGTENITKAQHCRAEVYLTGYGWVPVDPADVRKVVLEERAQPTTLADPIVPPVREKLFGAWEMNWLAFNDAHDLVLPDSRGGPVAFFMYPQGETANGRLDSLDPDNFKYAMRAREIAS
ncbi:MAG: transglutaminase domain-containing protein [Burkholderiales bacterium]